MLDAGAGGVDPAKPRRAFEHMRVDDAEYEDYVNCVAMPVRDASNRVVAAVSVTALKGRADLTALELLLPDLRAVTDNVSKELGWRP